MFLALLKRGDLYASQKGYESEEEKFLRENLERLKIKKNESEKVKQEYFDLKFEDWVGEISDDEKIKIVPPLGEPMGQFHVQGLKEYFKANVFEVEKQQ